MFYIEFDISETKLLEVIWSWCGDANTRTVRLLFGAAVKSESLRCHHAKSTCWQDRCHSTANWTLRWRVGNVQWQKWQRCDQRLLLKWRLFVPSTLLPLLNTSNYQLTHWKTTQPLNRWSTVIQSTIWSINHQPSVYPSILRNPFYHTVPSLL